MLGAGNQQGAREIRACPRGKERKRKERKKKRGKEGREREKEKREGRDEGRKKLRHLG